MAASNSFVALSWVTEGAPSDMIDNPLPAAGCTLQAR
jgi:hypothetical protein